MSRSGEPQPDVCRPGSMRSGASNTEWKTQLRRLKRDGSIIRFKLGTHERSRTPNPILHNPLRLTPSSEHHKNRVRDEEEAVETAHKNSLTAKHDGDLHRYPTMSVQIGGLREDPFRMFPIEHHSHVASAFDYYTTVYLPMALPALRGNFVVLNIPALLQQPLKFEAYIAFALLMQRVHHFRDSRMSKAILYHLNRATSALRQRLLSGRDDAVSDEVIMTINVLIAISHFTGNLGATDAHVRGLEYVMALRSEAKSLENPSILVKMAVSRYASSFDNFPDESYGLPTLIASAMDGWTARQKYLEYTQLPERETELFYPQHPFSPPLSEKMALFPTGFQDLALSGELSIQFIEYLHLTIVSAQLSGKGAGSVSTIADNLLGISTLPTMERLLGIALTTYNIYAERRFGANNPTYSYYVQCQFAVLATRPDLLICNPDTLAWACLIFRATTEKDTGVWRWADTRLRIMQPSESRQRELGRAFLPIP